MDESWQEYRRLILGELERLNLHIGRLEVKIDCLRDDDIGKLRVDVAMLQVRASLFGGIAGAAGGAIIATLVNKLLG